LPDNPEWKDMPLGKLPAEAIAECLGIHLYAGEVMFYAHAQKHTFEKKPERNGICMPNIEMAIAQPTHVGQQPGYEDKGFDLVCVVDDGPIVLVALSLRIRRGIYPVMSTYPLPRGTLERRLRVGTTKPI
jgi:hypothetical protein